MNKYKKVLAIIGFVILVIILGYTLFDYQSKQPKYYQVVKVVDGDTIDVNIYGAIERVRLIGIDTPELVDPRKPVECFAQEASDRAKALLTDQKVKLEPDPTQDERDKYGRLLRYVFLKNGANFNQMMIEEGYAHEYTYQLPYQYQAAFKQAEEGARNSGLGLWKVGACDNLK